MCDKTYEVICLFSTRVFLVYFFIRGSSIVFFSLCVTYVFLPYFLHVFFLSEHQTSRIRSISASEALRSYILCSYKKKRVLPFLSVYVIFFLLNGYYSMISCLRLEAAKVCLS